MDNAIKDITGQERTSSMDIVMYVVGALVLVLVVVGVIFALPDIKRYLRISSM